MKMTDQPVNEALIQETNHDLGIREIRLNRPPANALNPTLVGQLNEALARAKTDEVSGVILSGSPGIFSGGLDVPELLTLDEVGMRVFWTDFFGLLRSVATSPFPMVTALTGHSPAGGTVIALFADYRIQARGPFQLGLNEVQVGLVVPPVIHQALVRLIGAYPAERHLVAGQMVSVDKALALGLVDEVADATEIIGRAKAWLSAHLTMPRQAMLTTRAICRVDLARAFEAPGALDLDRFVQGWFSEETQQTMRALASRLKRV
jgi:3,2-trans-enoyl-CoA isomerase